MEEREYNLDGSLNEFVGRKTELELFRTTLEQFAQNEEDRKGYVLDVYGIGGVGKTTLLKKMRDEIEQGDNDFIPIYVDTSGDSSYIDILVKLRKELGNALDKEVREHLDIQFMLFDLLYKVFFDSYKVKFPFPLWKLLVRQSGNLLKVTIEEVFGNQTIDLNDIKTIMSSLNKETMTKVSQEMDVSLKVKSVRVIVRAILNGIDDIKENRLRKAEVKLLEENLNKSLGKLNSEYGRQKYLLEVFITAIKGFVQQHAVIFLIDNFRNNVQKKEVYRDFNWLTSERGLIKSVSGFFVIGERDSINYALNTRNDKNIMYIPVNLGGLQYEDIIKYYKKCCGICKNETLNEVEIFMLKAALADGDRAIFTQDEEIDFSQKNYLPIYMMLVADYYNEIKAQKELKEKNVVITVDNLGRIDRLEDLWFYFEMNMSEVRRDAFYILSCLNVWKEEWFQKVRERFDNYLLSAVHVLGSISSVEKIDHQELKLHDVVREKLYESPNNLIRFDVLEWFFMYFLHMQHIDFSSKIDFSYECDNEKGIKNIDELATYVYICKNYIEGIRYNDYSRFTQEEAMTKFLRAFERSLDFFDSPESVNEEIIQILKYIIKEFSGIFSQNSELRNLRYRLAFLYTHISRNLDSLQESRNLYEEAFHECENLPQKTERDLENFIFKLSDRNMKKNALAFDEGAVWNYEKAAEYGTATVRDQYELMCQAALYIDFTEEEREAFENILKFIAPDNSNLDDDAKSEYFQNVKIYKNSKYYQTYASEWDLKNFKDLFVAYTKARGNIPWFFLRIKKNDIRRKFYSDNFDPVIFGMKTYYIRKEIYGDGEATFRSKHNVSVYLSKEGRDEEALKLSEEVLQEIKGFSVGKEKKSDQEIEGKIKNLISLQLIPEKEIREAYNEYEDFLNYMGLAVEVLQYNSSYRHRIAERYKTDDAQFKENIKEAIKRGIAALTLRYITLSQYHKEILNSLSYLASYYYYIDKVEIAKKIMEYLVNLRSNGVEMPEEKTQEFEMMLQDMNDGIWNEDRRFSEQKL